MWILYTAIVATFSACYFFIGIVPIVLGAWNGMWLVFWLGIAAWVTNLLLIGCVRKSRVLD